MKEVYAISFLSIKFSAFPGHAQSLQVSATHFSTVHNTKYTWILISGTILVLAACS